MREMFSSSVSPLSFTLWFGVSNESCVLSQQRRQRAGSAALQKGRQSLSLLSLTLREPSHRTTLPLSLIRFLSLFRLIRSIPSSDAIVHVKEKRDWDLQQNTTTFLFKIFPPLLLLLSADS